MSTYDPNPNKRQFEWVPSPEIVAGSNLTAFLKQVDLPDHASLLARSEADPAWLMQQVFDFCDVRFHTPFERMLDTSDGIEWARWCVGGTTNIVLNCIDRHRGTPVWDQPFLVWEGESPIEQRSLTYAEFDREVQRSLATHGGQHGVRSLARDDLLEDLDRRDGGLEIGDGAYARAHGHMFG